MKTKKMQITIILVISVLLIVTFAVIIWANRVISMLTENENENTNKYNYHFAMVVENYDNPFWELVYSGALEKAQEENVIVEMTGTDFVEEYGLVDRMRMAISSGVDGAFVASDGSSYISDLIQNATQKEIPVLSMMENDSTSGRSGYVGINCYEQGQAYGKLIKDINESQEVHNVVLLSSSNRNEDGDYSSALIYSSIVEYLNKNELSEDITITIEDVNRASVFNSKRDIQQLLDKDGAPEILICTDYLFTMSTCQVVVDRNMVGKVKILGSYLSKDVLDYIQKGTLYGTVAVDPYELGEVCVSEMLELMEIGRTNDYMTIEMMTIDKSNVAEYRQKYLEEAL